MSDGIVQIGYELSNCRTHWPLLVVVDSLKHVDFIGRYSCRKRNPSLCQRLAQPTRWPNLPRGKWGLGHVSDDLGQFGLCGLPARFDEFDD